MLKVTVILPLFKNISSRFPQKWDWLVFVPITSERVDEMSLTNNQKKAKEQTQTMTSFTGYVSVEP